MSKTPHMPGRVKVGPSVDGDFIAIYPDNDAMEFPIAVKPCVGRDDIWLADAERFARCWNACLDIDDPSVVPEAIAALDADLLEDLADDLDRGASPSRQSEIANDLRDMMRSFRTILAKLEGRS